MELSVGLLRLLLLLLLLLLLRLRQRAIGRGGFRRGTGSGIGFIRLVFLLQGFHSSVVGVRTVVLVTKIFVRRCCRRRGCGGGVGGGCGCCCG